MAEFYNEMINNGIVSRVELKYNLCEFVEDKFPDMKISEFGFLEDQLYFEFFYKPQREQMDSDLNGVEKIIGLIKNTTDENELFGLMEDLDEY